MDSTLLLAATLAAIFLWKLFGDRRRNALIEKIPGPKAYPIIGNMLDLMVPTNMILKRVFERREKYGPTVRLWNGTKPLVGVSAPEHVEVILSNNQELKKSFVYDLVAAWLGNGLLISYGERWFKHRKLITPTFHFKILDSFVPVYESHGEILVQKLKEQIKKEQPFDLYPFVTNCALDIICETAMGINLQAQEKSQSEYIDAVYTVSQLLTERTVRPHYRIEFIYKFTDAGRRFKKALDTLHGFTERVIKERRELLKNAKPEEEMSEDGVKKRKAFLDLLLQDKNNDLSDLDLREEVDTFMFAGHDTTTAGICWSSYLLGLHPDIQDEVAEEVKQIWPKGEQLTMQRLSEMKLLERVIKESLRIYPSVPFISRDLINDLQLGEYLIPAGTTVSVIIAALHKNPEVFPDPEKFDPDRFLPENAQNRHPYAYIPFSAGPRNCLGQKFALLEEKALLATILRDFKITSMDKREDVSYVVEVILRPENGIRVKLTPRE